MACRNWCDEMDRRAAADGARLPSESRMRTLPDGDSADTNTARRSSPPSCLEDVVLQGDMANRVDELVREYTGTTVRGFVEPGRVREGHMSADARLAAGGDAVRQGTLPGFCMDRIYAMLHFLWVALRDVRRAVAADVPKTVTETTMFVKRLTPRAKYEMERLAKACNGGRDQIEGSMCLSQHVCAFCGAALQHLLHGPMPQTEAQRQRPRDQPRWQVQWEWAKDLLNADDEDEVVTEVVQAMRRFQAKYDEARVHHRRSS